jgi:hypothetical protein
LSINKRDENQTYLAIKWITQVSGEDFLNLFCCQEDYTKFTVQDYCPWPFGNGESILGAAAVLKSI